MWKFLSVGLLGAILISLGFATPVQAQTSWCYIFDFENEDDGGWVRRTSNGENNGDYTEGVGWTHTDHVNTNPSPDLSLRGVVIMRDFEARTLTHVTLVYDYIKGNNDGVPANSLITTVIQINESGSFLASRIYGNEADANDKLLQWNGEQTGVSNLVLFSRSSRDITAPYTYGGLVTFTLVRVEGLGTNPFGADNCESTTASFTAEPDSGIAPLEVEFTDTSSSSGTITGWAWDFGDGGSSTDQNPTHVFEEPGDYTVELTVTSTVGSDTHEMVISVTDSGGPPAGTWTRPLMPEDEYGDNPLISNETLIDLVFEGSADPLPAISTLIVPGTLHRVSAFSTDPGAFVMAAQPGTVIDIEYASPAMCFIWGVLLEQACYIGGPNSGPQLFDLYQFPITFDVQAVTIELSDGTHLRYMVEKADQYVKLGQEVEAGCVLGETIAAERMPISEAAERINFITATHVGLDEFLEAGDDPRFGVTLIELRDETQPVPMLPLIQNLTVHNPDPEPCNVNSNFQDCLLTNPELRRDAESWTLFGGAEAFEAGVVLPPQAYLQQVVNLPEETTFSFRVGFYFDVLDLLGGLTGQEREILLRVGTFQTTEVVEVTAEYQEIVVEVPAPEIPPGDLGYTVRIQNSSDQGGIIVQAACLSTTDRELNPLNCYFQNPDFDGISGWTAPFATQIGAGFIQIGNLQSISQPVSLQPNEDDSPRTYRLEVDARVVPAPGVTYDPESGEALLDYSWEGNTGEIGSLDLQWNTPGNPGYPDAFQTISVDIEVDEPTSGTFNIVSVITDNSTIRGIAISRACLSADPEGPPTSGVSGPFQTTCNTIPVPTDDSIGLWTMYHWRNLDKFFNCKLMVLLNKWFRVFDEFRKTSLLFMRYSVALVQRGVDWLTTAMWWLNGHLRNIAVGQVVVVNEAGGCNNFFCAIVDVVGTLASLLNPVIAALNNVVNVLLGVLIGAVNLFFTLVEGLIGFVVALVIRLFTFLQTGLGLLTGLVTAYNTATPTAIPGLPTCASDPDSSLICRGVWVLDNTILAGRWGVLFTIILSVLAIHLILWAIREFREVLLKTWSSS